MKKSTLGAEIAALNAIMHGRSSAPLDARLILAHCMEVSKEVLGRYSLNSPVDPKVALRSRKIARKCQHGYPIAYLYSQKEFYAHTFKVTRHTLVPRPESELLVELALWHIRTHDMRVVHECGVGSGAIIISIAAHAPVRASGTEVSRRALRVARHNATTLLGKGCITLLHGSLFTPLTWQPQVAVANLPYLTTAEVDSLPLHYEPRIALDGGTEGLDCIRRGISQACQVMPKGGYLFLECAPTQKEAIQTLCASHNLGPLTWHLDLAGKTRVVSIPF